MTDFDDDGGSHLSMLLRERALEVQPDLTHHVAVARKAGNRLIRRRRVAVGSTVLAGSAAAVLVGVQLWPAPSPAPVAGGFAANPDDTSEDPVQDPADCLSQLHQSRVQVQAGRMPAEALPTDTPRSDRVEGDHQPTLIHVDDWDSCPPTTPLPPQDLPVTVKAPGWKCDPPADDRFGCTNGTDIVTVTVRSAAVRDDYLHDPDKATDTYASELHGDVFATVMGVNPIAVHEVAEHLVWK